MEVLRGEWLETSIEGVLFVCGTRPIEIRLREAEPDSLAAGVGAGGEVDCRGLESNSGLLPDRGTANPAARPGLVPKVTEGVVFLTSALVLNGFSRGDALDCHLGGLKYSSKRTLIAAASFVKFILLF
jgi:hypothetical protein